MPKPRPIEDRFWEKVRKLANDQCWEWKGATYNKKGYGCFWGKGGPVAAHRLSYELHHGPIPDGLHVLHTCDNPACVNPLHIYAGTNLENVQDAVRRRRHPVGEDAPRARFTNADIVAMHRLHAEGKSGRWIARKYQTSPGHVNRILRGIVWGHLMPTR